MLQPAPHNFWMKQAIILCTGTGVSFCPHPPHHGTGSYYKAEERPSCQRSFLNNCHISWPVAAWRSVQALGRLLISHRVHSPCTAFWAYWKLTGGVRGGFDWLPTLNNTGTGSDGKRRVWTNCLLSWSEGVAMGIMMNPHPGNGSPEQEWAFRPQAFPIK